MYVMSGERRAQITLFVAVGLVAIIIFGIIFLKSSSTNPTVKETATNTVNNIADDAVISQYLSSCLDTVVNNELRKFSKSGGLTDENSQPSAVRSGQTIPTLYGLIINNDDDYNQPRAEYSPDYPSAGVSFYTSSKKNFKPYPGNLEKFQPRESGYFGDVTFPATCENSGGNIMSGANPCNYYGGSAPSMQKYFTQQITIKAQSCANSDIFNRNAGNRIDAITAPIPNVTFTPDMILVTFKYNITLKDKSQEVLPITRKYSVRFLSIAEFAHDLAFEESHNIFFNISNELSYKSIPSYRDGFVVLKKNKENISSHKFVNPVTAASLITIIDSKSSLDNVAYSFSFLMEHRVPMLEQLTVREQCDESNIPTIGIDPDDTNVTITAPITQFAPICNDPIEGTCPENKCHCDYLLNCTVTDLDKDKDWQEFYYQQSCDC